MYQSKIKISTENKRALSWKMLIFLELNTNIYCKSLKKQISLSKLPDVIFKRKESATSRMKRFFVAIDVLKKEKVYKKRVEKKMNEYEIIGLDQDWVKVYIHLREEINKKKDKIIYFISCY